MEFFNEHRKFFEDDKGSFVIKFLTYTDISLDKIERILYEKFLFKRRRNNVLEQGERKNVPWWSYKWQFKNKFQLELTIFFTVANLLFLLRWVNLEGSAASSWDQQVLNGACWRTESEPCLHRQSILLLPCSGFPCTSSCKHSRKRDTWLFTHTIQVPFYSFRFLLRISVTYRFSFFIKNKKERMFHKSLQVTLIIV